jgi:predicted DNA-binding protein (MmcQ/YjbR family)
MDLEALYAYAAAKPGVTEGTPFGPDVLVLKVGGKMFALLSPDDVPPRVNLKCDPEEAVRLRERYPEAVLPGYHMNKKHWNTVVLRRGLPSDLVRQMVDASYRLVAAGLPKRERKKLRVEG